MNSPREGSSPLVSRGELAALIAVVLLFLAFYFIPGSSRGEDVVEKGGLDAATLGRDIAPLLGEWAVLEDSGTEGEGRRFARLPYAWERPYGYVAYRLAIKGLDPNAAYALQVPYMDTSYRLRADGKVIFSEGIPGKSAGTTRSSYRSGVAKLPPGSEEVELVLEVANYTHRQGGPCNAIYFGEARDIERYDLLLLIENAVVMAIGLALGAIYLLDAMIRRRVRFLYIALIFLLGGLNVFIASPPMFAYLLFPSLDFGLFKRLYYLFAFLVSPCAVLAAHSLFGGLSNRSLASILGAYAIVISPILLTPYYVFTKIYFVYQIAHFLMFLAAFAICFRGVSRGYPFAKLITAAFLLVFGITLSDMLFMNSKINSGQFLALSFLSAFFDLPFLDRRILDALSYVCLFVLMSAFSLAAFIESAKRPSPEESFAEGGDEDRIRGLCAAKGLSQRETEIALSALRGKTNAQIGEELFISLSTVKTHMSRVFAKTGTKTRGELFSLFWK
jgi:DNA-binding CsgD family transcriptional regulator